MERPAGQQASGIILSLPPSAETTDTQNTMPGILHGFQTSELWSSRLPTDSSLQPMLLIFKAKNLESIGKHY